MSLESIRTKWKIYVLFFAELFVCGASTFDDFGLFLDGQIAFGQLLEMILVCSGSLCD